MPEQVAFQIHHGIEDGLLAPLESVLQRHPKVAVIWCHMAMIRYPERFLLASDCRPQVEHMFAQMMEMRRTLILDALSEPARHLEAYGNAWRLITGQRWS